MAGAGIAVAMVKARRDIIDHFSSADATAPDRAVAYDPAATGFRGRRLRTRMFGRMRDFGVLKQVGADRFYLDRERLADWHGAMRTRAIGLVAIAGAVAAAVFALAG